MDVHINNGIQLVHPWIHGSHLRLYTLPVFLRHRWCSVAHHRLRMKRTFTYQYVYVMHLKSLRMAPLHGSLLGSDVRILSESTAVSHRTIPCYSVSQGWCLEIICLVGFALLHDSPNIAGFSGLVWLVSLPSTVQLPPTKIPTFSLKPLLQRPVGFTAETLAVNPLFEQLWSGIKINETVKWCKLDNRSRKDPQHYKAASS